MRTISAAGVTRAATVLAALAVAGTANAYPLYEDDNSKLNFDLELGLGLFNSDKVYTQTRSQPAHPTWEEFYVKYGFSGEHGFSGKGSVYGALNLVTSATRGQGDPAGFTSGDEGATDIEEGYIGWRSGGLVSWLGEDGIDISVGSQILVIGDGFLVNGDIFDFGNGFDALASQGAAPRGLDRGGAYYLAPRRAFRQTVVLRLGGEQGWHADGFWLKTDNKGQADTELAGVNFEYRSAAYGTVGVTYLEGLDVERTSAAFLGLSQRDGQETFAVRGRGHLGIKTLTLAGEYVTQNNGRLGRDHAWYAEGGWAFAELPATPEFNYRYSSFSRGYDPLFYGFNRYGTWYQGEVAGNFAGPFSTGADIQQIRLTLKPLPAVKFGILFFDFDNTASGATDGNEIDIYAEWAVTEHLFISPLVGLYTPDHSAVQGGTQLGDDDTNVLAGLYAVFNF